MSRPAPTGPAPGAARRAALKALLRLEREPDATAADTLDRETRAARLDDRDTRFAHALAFAVVRHRSRLDALVTPLLRAGGIGAMAPEVACLLRMAAAQRALMDRVPPHAIAADTTALARHELRLDDRRAGFVNAVARRLANLPDEAIAPAAAAPDATGPERRQRLAGIHSHPLWLVELLENAFGPDRLEPMLAADNTEAPLTLRANRLADGGRDAVAARLAGETGAVFAPGAVAPDALIAPEGMPVQVLLATPAFAEGLFYFQDEASQLVAPLAAPRAGERVLDLCAAPGGKATHLAEVSGGLAAVTATDSGAARLGRLRQNVARLRTPGIEVADYAAATAEGRGYDVVVVDAPCSGLGTLRRHPEIRWRVTPADLDRLAVLQSEILRLGARLTAPGGRLVYSTCTFTERENAYVVEAFLEGHPEFHRADAVSTWPDHPGLDGFHAALLQRR